MDRRVLQASRAISRRLAGQGAEAVVVFGSRVRGDAYKESDIDIHAIGKGHQRMYRLERYGDFLVSIFWMTAKQHRQAFKNPNEAGGIIPAWRNAAIIYDPRGIASAIKQEAKKWRWEQLNKKADRWVAEETTGYAEEVHRLIGNLQLGRTNAAAIVRSILAIKMAPILAVHYRILYDTENQLWDLVSTEMGTNWAQIQSTALGEDTQSFEDTCKAALQLYAIVAREVRHLLNPQQYKVVAHACKIAGHSLQD
jgi:predicted nucleotidyltransferase